MDITHGNDIWSKLKDKCSDKMYEALIHLRDNLDTKYGEGKVQYILEYAGIDEEGTETVTVMLAGAVITYGSVKVTKDGEVII